MANWGGPVCDGTCELAAESATSLRAADWSDAWLVVAQVFRRHCHVDSMLRLHRQGGSRKG